MLWQAPTMHAEIVQQLKSAVAANDVSLLRPVLAKDVRFGSCVGRPQVLQFLGHARQTPSPASIRDDALADRLVVVLDQGSRDPDESSSEGQGRTAVLFLRHGEVVELQVVRDPDEALEARPTPPPEAWSGTAATLTELAAVLPVGSLSRALEHYDLLGFAVSAYRSGDYGYAERDGLKLHFRVVPELDPARALSAVYLYVDDADALFAEWRSAGVSGQFFEPCDTEYGLREGAHIDLDGNLLRFGSPSHDNRSEDARS
jgi:hypothetical protein